MNPKDCDTIRPLLTPYVDREAAPEEIRSVESHLENCSGCASEVAFLRAFARSFVAPPLMLPPPELSARIARTTYARPTWTERLFGALRPAPVRLALSGCLAAGLCFSVWNTSQKLPTNHVKAGAVTTASVSENVAPVAPLVRSDSQVAPAPAPVPVGERRPATVAKATVRPGRPVATRTASGPKRTIPSPTAKAVPRPTGVRESGGLARLASASLKTPSPTSTAIRSAAPVGAETHLVASVATGSRNLGATLSAANSPDVAPASVASSARGVVSARLLVGDDDLDDSRASYQAGLNAQSEASRIGSSVVRAGLEAANRLAVVNAPVTTSNR